MILTDFRTRKYTGGIISPIGIFLTVTPGLFCVFRLKFSRIPSVASKRADGKTNVHPDVVSKP